MEKKNLAREHIKLLYILKKKIKSLLKNIRHPSFSSQTLSPNTLQIPSCAKREPYDIILLTLCH